MKTVIEKNGKITEKVKKLGFTDEKKVYAEIRKYKKNKLRFLNEEGVDFKLATDGRDSKRYNQSSLVYLSDGAGDGFISHTKLTNPGYALILPNGIFEFATHGMEHPIQLPLSKVKIKTSTKQSKFYPEAIFEASAQGKKTKVSVFAKGYFGLENSAKWKFEPPTKKELKALSAGKLKIPKLEKGYEFAHAYPKWQFKGNIVFHSNYKTPGLSVDLTKSIAKALNKSHNPNQVLLKKGKVDFLFPLIADGDSLKFSQTFTKDVTLKDVIDRYIKMYKYATNNDSNLSIKEMKFLELLKLDGRTFKVGLNCNDQ